MGIFKRSTSSAHALSAAQTADQLSRRSVERFYKCWGRNTDIFRGWQDVDSMVSTCDAPLGFALGRDVDGGETGVVVPVAMESCARTLMKSPPESTISSRMC